MTTANKINFVHVHDQPLNVFEIFNVTIAKRVPKKAYGKPNNIKSVSPIFAPIPTKKKPNIAAQKQK